MDTPSAKYLYGRTSTFGVSVNVTAEEEAAWDAEAQAERRALAADQPKVPVVVEPAIVPVAVETPGPVVDVTLEPSGADVFGVPVPGEAVDVPDRIDPCANYTPKARWGRRLDGKPVRLDGLQGPPISSVSQPVHPAVPAGVQPVPNFNDSFPSAYLKASDLSGRIAVVTIERVEFAAVGREKDMRAIVHFVGKQKGLVCNKTNGKKIAEIANSPLTEDWSGVALALYPTECEFSGETVDCIRVKAVQRSQPSQRPSIAAPLPVIQRRVVNAPDVVAANEDEVPF